MQNENKKERKTKKANYNNAKKKKFKNRTQKRQHR